MLAYQRCQLLVRLFEAGLCLPNLIGDLSFAGLGQSSSNRAYYFVEFLIDELQSFLRERELIDLGETELEQSSDHRLGSRSFPPVHFFIFV